MTCAPGSPGTPPLHLVADAGGAAAPARRLSSATHTRVALRELGRRAEFLDGQLERLDDLIGPLVTAHAPGLLALHGVGSDTAALLLIAAGDHPERLRSRGRLGAPVRRRPDPGVLRQDQPAPPQPGGDRQANHALWRIVITRMSSHPATRAYVDRRTDEGLSKKEIIRCLKRYVAREVYPHLRHVAADSPRTPGAA